MENPTMPFRVFVDGLYWGVIYAPDPQAACRETTARWLEQKGTMPSLVRAFEIEQGDLKSV